MHVPHREKTHYKFIIYNNNYSFVVNKPVIIYINYYITLHVHMKLTPRIGAQRRLWWWSLHPFQVEHFKEQKYFGFSKRNNTC